MGIACGAATRRAKPELATAGSARDDGSGLLAQASTGLERNLGGNTYGGASYTGAWGAKSYGGAVYGGGRYANYKFHQRTPRESDISSYAADYVVDETLKRGRIAGTVKWAKAPASLRLVAAGCDANIKAKSESPQHAVVFLRKIKRGRGFPKIQGHPTRRWQVGGVLSVDACNITPYVQVVGPRGAIVRARLTHNGPDSLRVRTAKDYLGTATKGTAALEFGAMGDERLTQLRDDGMSVVTNKRGADAWIVTADHPFYVALDPNSGFMLLDVPVGSYELVAWHPPVVLASGKISNPLETARRVSVRAGRTTSAKLTLPSR